MSPALYDDSTDPAALLLLPLLLLWLHTFLPQDVKEKLFGMSETATAMAIIRSRDPRFDMTTLLEGVR
jgi:hypothetical protein